MPKIQKCRNGCNHYITVMEHEGKWKPFDVSEDGDVLDLHNCPNSPYNQQGGGGGGKFFQSKKPTTATKGSFSIATPSETTTENKGEQAMKTKFSAAGETMDVKRIRVMLQEYAEKIDLVTAKLDHIIEFINQNTLIDTNKLIGQLQHIYDLMVKLEPIPSTKTANQLLSPPPPSQDNDDPTKEFEQMKDFTKGNNDDDDDNDDDYDGTKGRATGGVED